MHPPDRETRNPAARQGNGAIARADFNDLDHIETASNIQAFRLASRFGFAFETAVVISQLAWGLSR